MYQWTGEHPPPGPSHVVPSRLIGSRNLKATCTSPNLNTAVAVLFLFLLILFFCLYAVKTDDAKINPHIFSS